MIRVVGGEWKGRQLVVPKDVGTRPSSARLREALFSSLGRWVLDAEVHDLFAGTGALGIEALSRGARSVTFVELDARAVRVIRKNLERVGADESRYAVRRADARRWLDRLCEDRSPNPLRRLILLDPPYESQVVADLLPMAQRLLESSRPTVLAFEHLASFGEIEVAETVSVRTRRHGEGAFTILERAES